MDKISIALTTLLMLAMVILMAPRVIMLNRGKFLRNTAIWLAIAVVLALGYKNFGPGSPHPMFKEPDGIAMRYGKPASTTDDKNDEAHNGFTPPKE